MPELPDVETFRRRLDAAAGGCTVASVQVDDRRLLENIEPAALARTLEGSRIDATRRHGKHLFARAAGRDWLVVHFGMTGAIVPFAADDDPPPYSRVRIMLDGGMGVAVTSKRMLGHVALCQDPDAYARAAGLGPDALDPGLGTEAFRRTLAERKAAIKGVLMDQGLMAGIGNVYADEILFRAAVHPKARADSLDIETVDALHAAIRAVLETAIEAGAGDEDFAQRLPGDFLLPHREDGAECPRCGGTVEALKVSGRTAYLCPRCQKPRAGSDQV